MDPVTLLQQLIQIPSVNPDNKCANEYCGEEKLAFFLKPIFESLNYTVSLEYIENKRPNLIAKAPNSEGKPRILFCPHLDTVGVDNMTIEPFSGELKDGKIWGRGSSDTKGPMAAMISGLISQQESLSQLPIAIDFAGFIGEETTQIGSKDFAEKYGNDYLFAVAAEPTNLDIVHLTKGSCWFTLYTEGVAAHSSRPHLGENAIVSMTNALAIFVNEMMTKLAHYSNDKLGSCTLNLGTISGGSKPNLVPHYCEVEFDMRTTPELAGDIDTVTLIKSILKQHTPLLKLKSYHNNPPMLCEENNQIIRLIQEVGMDSNLASAPWFSDAAHLCEGGIPSIAFGPGSIDQAHTKDEFITLKDYNLGCEFFHKFIEKLKSYS